MRSLWVKADLPSQQNNKKPSQSQKLNNSLLNDTLVREEIKDFLEFNENEGIAYPNIWDTVKEILRGNFIALSAFIKKLERSYNRSLTIHLKA